MMQCARLKVLRAIKDLQGKIGQFCYYAVSVLHWLHKTILGHLAHCLIITYGQLHKITCKNVHHKTDKTNNIQEKHTRMKFLYLQH